MILHLVFIRLRPELGEDLLLSGDEKAAIADETDKIAEALWTPSEQRRSARHFKSVFCDLNDCRHSKAEVMRALNQANNNDSCPR